MFKSKKNLFIFILFLFSIFNTNASVSSQDLQSNVFNYLNFYNTDKLSMNLVSYEILYNKNYTGQLNFELKINYENSKTYFCSRNISMNGIFLFKKITCEVPKFGFGKYTFSSKIYFENKLIASSKNIEILKPKLIKIIFKKTNTSINFEPFKNQTIITLFLKPSNKSLILENKIPKSVIKYLDNKNKNSLISSKNSFKIINSDPIIAWDIEPGNNNITYIIHKKISSEQMKEFKLKITQTKTFDFFQLIILGLIILIVIIIFRPLFKKK